MSKPLIGITASQMKKDYYVPRAFLNQAYITAVARAGGIPILLPVGIGPANFDDLFARIDGVLLSGGEDMDPSTYGEPMHREVSDVNPPRDEMEIAMVRWLIEAKKPFLGICRGFEVLNVAMGGTLYTHISDQLPGALLHPCYPNLPRDLLSHSVEVKSGSKLAGLLGEGELWVNSLHHQGVDKVAEGLQATAHAPDGLVEGLELPEHPFGLAVQWHPEELRESPQMQNLFKSLVEASQD